MDEYETWIFLHNDKSNDMTGKKQRVTSLCALLKLITLYHFHELILIMTLQ